jgi:hypothetical protein
MTAWALTPLPTRSAPPVTTCSRCAVFANQLAIERTTDMNDTTDSSFLIGAVLHDLVIEAESLLLLSNALEDRASGIESAANPQKLREAAAIVKSAALQVGIAAANIVGAAERLRLVAEFAEITNVSGGDLPS